MGEGGRHRLSNVGLGDGRQHAEAPAAVALERVSAEDALD